MCVCVWRILSACCCGAFGVFYQTHPAHVSSGLRIGRTSRNEAEEKKKSTEADSTLPCYWRPADLFSSTLPRA